MASILVTCLPAVLAPGAAEAQQAPRAGGNRPTGAPAAATTPTTKPGQKAQADTATLPQFEQTLEYEPRNPNYRVSFSLEDADLSELVRVIGQLTGKRFIFSGKVKNIKATIYAPQKVTVAEAYQAFLSILETNGLTVVPHGRFLKIIESGGIASQGTPVYGAGQGAPGEDRYVTRIHRLTNVSATEVAAVLGKFKSKDADITTYEPGNLLIITDTGTNIRRMMQIVEEVDVGASGDQVWIEPVHYGTASDLANRINETFDLKGGAPAGGGGKPGGAPAAAAAGGAGPASGDLHVSKVLADDRTNSLIIVATERAYLRILEFLKRVDVPQTGEGEIHVIPLQHADAKDLAKTLQEIVTGAAAPGSAPPGRGAPAPAAGQKDTGIFEGGVRVSSDPATNSIVVTSSPRDYAQLRAVLDKLDRPRRQVFIDAVILDLSIERGINLGVAFHGGAPIGEGDQQSLFVGGLDAQKTVAPQSFATSLLQGMALGLRGPAIPNSQNITGLGFSIPAFGVVLNALASDRDSDVLSTPHILATDNVPAEINVGENIALQQSFGGVNPALLGGLGAAAAGGAAGATGVGGLGGLGFGGFGTAPRQDVGTKIKITPHLNESNEVRLELQEEISEPKAGDPQGQLQVIPLIKRTAQTTLVVKDQQTVVVGGLMRKRYRRGVSKIPILGDIPVLGALFRNTQNQSEKTNLLLILTPYIIRDQSDLRAVFERKMQERQEFIDRYFVFSDDLEYNPAKDYSRTNGLLEDIRQSYNAVDERQRLDELLRPKQLKTHAPGEPLQLPGAGRTSAAGAGATTATVTPTGAGTPAPAPTTTTPVGTSPAVNTPPRPATPPPNINVTPPPRNVERIER